MHRYRLLMFYEDKATQTRVAQIIVVIEASDQAAIQAAKADLANTAVGGRIQSIKVIEKLSIAPGVVFRGEPYIPMNWPDAQSSPTPGPKHR